MSSLEDRVLSTEEAVRAIQASHSSGLRGSAGNMELEVPPSEQGANGEKRGNNHLKKVSWWHKAIVDWMLENPSKSLGECAEYFDVTESWLSTIRNSDAFQGYEKARRAEHNENVSTSVIKKVEGLAELGLDVLTERIKKERNTIGLKSVIDASDMALKALGFGGGKGGGSAGQAQSPLVNINLVDPALLERSRQKMRELNGIESPAPPLLDVKGQASEMPSSS